MSHAKDILRGFAADMDNARYALNAREMHCVLSAFEFCEKYAAHVDIVVPNLIPTRLKLETAVIERHHKRQNESSK